MLKGKGRARYDEKQIKIKMLTPKFSLKFKAQALLINFQLSFIIGVLN